VETRVELLFDVKGSRFLTEEEKAIIVRRLGNRISEDGVLALTATGHRSQHRNRKEALHRFFQLIETALKPEKPAKGHKPRRPDPEARMRNKKIQSQKKALRFSLPLRP